MGAHPRKSSFVPSSALRAAAGLVGLGLLVGCVAPPRWASASAGPVPPAPQAPLTARGPAPSVATDLSKGTPLASEAPLGPSGRYAKSKRCTKDTDCPGDELCDAGRCKLPGGSQAEAEEPADEGRSAQDEPAAVVITAKAKEHFSRGVELLEVRPEPDYRAAWKEFAAAYRESPSPKILSNLGLCTMMVERDGESIEAYERYLAEVPGIDPRERAKINKDLQELWARVTPIELSIKPDGAKVIDERTPDQGEPIVNEYGPLGGKVDLGVRAGKHQLRIELDGYEPAEWSFEADPGKPRSKSVTLRKKGGAAATGKPGGTSSGASETSPTGEPDGTEPSAGVPTSVWVMLGVTGALAAGGGVVGILALDAKSTYDSYQEGGDREDAEVVRADGETLNIVTDVLLGAAILAGVTTLIVGLTAGPDDPDEADETDETDEAAEVSWTLGPGASPQGGGLFLRGTF